MSTIGYERCECRTVFGAQCAAVKGHLGTCVESLTRIDVDSVESATVAAIAAWLRSHGWTRQADAIERGEWRK